MRSKDRLPELHLRAARAGGAVYGDTTVTLADNGTGAGTEPDKELLDMLQEVERVYAWTRDVRRNTQFVRRLHSDTTFHTNRQLQQQLESAVTESNAVGLKACGALRQLEAAARAGTSGTSARGTRARAARLHAACARRLLAAALADHHVVLQALRDDRLLLMHKQMNLTNLTISDEECQSLLDTNNVALFVDNVQAETAEARLQLRELEAQRDELLRVETSLREVRDLFTQLAHLVALQQDQVDSVEYYALQAGHWVDAGGQQLLKGSVSHAKSRKKKMGLVICLASGFLIVLLVLIFT